ncbi:DUF2339 domain-containing protein [Alkalilimnicola sp. S0819]|uniref:DUF2339 domain-containing protein n=1 Tax=Alkalilimnicola sp. S0819 TaxID=2613922 RepID=UPI001261CCC9|nr:DUF2339 domain-containing protein [Alkalilimnicola sp. S0819]KAB7624151.1 DUF2339 domain-containing protein [Alkalilimnicola sp. S0819]MPQ16404.1 DUF2339 domain-containing protein [Alkalilimnicola sp. S0819]
MGEIIVLVVGLVAVIGAAGGVCGYWLAKRGELHRRLSALEREMASLRQAPPAAPRPQPRETPRTRASFEPEPAPTPAPTAGPEPDPAPQPAPLRSEPVRPAARTTPAPQPPAAPDIVLRAWNWLRGGNTLARVGAVVLFFGVAFLLKYAAEEGMMPIELRLMGAAAGGLALLIIGFRLRHKRRDYALVMQGAGIGIVYLTSFAALQLYHLIPAAAAFLLLAGLTAGAVALAVLQNAPWLAMLGVAGGFLAPVLTSTGDGNHVLLFSYYLILNTAILAIAWFKAWRSLNLLGFAFTFGIGTAWGLSAYQQTDFATAEFFLIAHVLLYTAIALLYAHRQPPRLTGLVDGTLIFGTPVLGFSLQAGMVQHHQYGLAISAAVAGLFYLCLATLLWRRLAPTARSLVEAFLALGVAFATLAIPLAVEGRWTAAAWALEGAGIAWVSIRQRRRLALAFALLLQLVAAPFFAVDVAYGQTSLPLLNPVYLGCLLLSLAALFSGWYLHRHRRNYPHNWYWLPPVLLGWGLLWWIAGAGAEIQEFVAQPYRQNALLAVLAVTALLTSSLRRPLHWSALRWPAVGLLPVMGALTLTALAPVLDYGALYRQHPLGALGYLAWPLAFAIHYAVLQQRRDDLPPTLLAPLHAAGLWLGVLWLSWEVSWWLHGVAGGAWPLAAWGAVPAVSLALINRILVSRPTDDTAQGYRQLAAYPLAGWLLLWGLGANLTSSGAPGPLPYVPLLNPLDAATLLAALAVLRQLLAGRNTAWGRALPEWAGTGAPALLGFVWFSAMIARSVHYWADVAYRLPALMQSVILQASWSLSWSLLAFAVMGWAHRRGARRTWMTGAGLCALVVVKLFLVDLAGTGTLARIVSFTGVGLLLLAVGYFAPLPPNRAREASR